jgi:muconolactone delta-isomerase
MKILAIEHERSGATAEKFGQHSAAEALRVWELHQQGIIRELYFRADRSEAVLILECDSTETAKQVLLTLPLVQKGLIAFELIPLKAYPGFARLFSTQE